MREQRIKISTPELDKLEMEWWNTNAATIEKIWALSYHHQKIIREPYLQRMKSFFTSNAKQKPVKIMEVGCGSGWVCRLVADEDFHVIGTDFSEGQLAIAKEQAKVYNKEHYCSYELADASSFEKQIDGVVIHALLHHLSAAELDVFFNELAKLPAGTKVFMYEPVFIERSGKMPSLRDKLLHKLTGTVKQIAIDRAKKKGNPDTGLETAMKKIEADAERNGWYISPKEVPFYEHELSGYLNPLFTIQKKYVVNKSDLDISQALMMNKIEKPDFIFSKILLPLSIWLDRLSFKGNFTFYIAPLNHQFVCFELVRK